MHHKVLIIGGLGFVGLHIVRELQAQNYSVTIGSRSKTNTTDSTAPILYIDLEQMSDTIIEDCILDFDILIFAGGADDRKFPDEPADQFFYNGNVTPCVRLAQISRNLNVQKFIILGSYFTHFHRLRPDWKMAEQHPYVQSRVLQYNETVKASEGKTQVIVLELPYIFGAVPDKIPLWKPLINYIKKSPIVFYTKGGTNIVAVEQVAKATLGAIENLNIHTQIIVGNQNVTWKQLIKMIATSLGKKRLVISLPTFLVKLVARLAKFYFRIRKKQSGLDIANFIKIQTSKTYLETHQSMKVMNYQKVDMQTSIDETVKACKL